MTSDGRPVELVFSSVFVCCFCCVVAAIRAVSAEPRVVVASVVFCGEWIQGVRGVWKRWRWFGVADVVARRGCLLHADVGLISVPVLLLSPRSLLRTSAVWKFPVAAVSVLPYVDLPGSASSVVEGSDACLARILCPRRLLH